MKNRYIFTFLSLISAAAASAIPADPTPRTLVQPDGSVITVSIQGDEFGHRIVDDKGRTVRFDINSGMFVETPRSSFKGMPQKSSSPRKIKRTNYPTTGKQSSLVVLVEFSDQPFLSVEDPHTFYDRMLNEEGFTWNNGARGSARDFYLDSSDGKFDPTFVVVGPVKVSHPATYYGEDFGVQDAKMGELLEEALNAVDDIVDFSEYDKDNDGTIDNVFFFYSGYGQADYPGGSAFIWPHSADAAVAWDKHLVYDGKEFHTYACSNEVRYSTIGEVKPTGIGTFVHEFGHVLGLADHYDTLYSQFAFGIGTWDTMASGAYNNNMHTPPVFTAFERAELGWMDYIDLDTSVNYPAELPWVGNGDAQGFRVKVPGNENEWFVLENRQQVGWDEYIPGHGLLIWHVEMDEERWMENTVNTDAQHQLLDIVEVDGIGTDSTRDADVMPGAANITRYSLLSWNQGPVITIDDVEEINYNREDAIIRILVEGSDFSLETPSSLEVSNLSDVSFDIEWDEVADARYYIVDISCDGVSLPKYENLRLEKPSKINIPDLIPFTAYLVSVTAGRGSYLSEPFQKEVTTLPLAFNKRTIDNMEITEVIDGGFTLLWTPVADAEDHLVNLFTISRDYESTRKGYGFDDRMEGLPLSWVSTASSFNSTEGGYGAAAPSLRMISDGDYVEISYPEMLIDKLSFWNADNGSANKFIVEISEGAGWSEIATVELSKDGKVSEFNLPGVEKVRIRLEKSAGYALLDDIYASGRILLHTPVEKYVMTSAGNSGSFTFSSLDAGLYGVNIVAVNGEEKSLTSEEMTVEIATSGVETVIGNIRNILYYIDLSGNKSSEPCKGFNIAVYNDGSVKKIMNK